MSILVAHVEADKMAKEELDEHIVRFLATSLAVKLTLCAFEKLRGITETHKVSLH